MQPSLMKGEYVQFRMLSAYLSRTMEPHHGATPILQVDAYGYRTMWNLTLLVYCTYRQFFRTMRWIYGRQSICVCSQTAQVCGRKKFWLLSTLFSYLVLYLGIRKLLHQQYWAQLCRSPEHFCIAASKDIHSHLLEVMRCLQQRML